MNSRSGYCGAAVIALAIATGPARADLTAQDVWSDWRSYYMSFTGYEITASENQAGDTLIVSDLNLTMPVKEMDGGVIMSAAEISFRENGDGTVTIILPATMPVSISGEEDGVDFAMRIDLGMDGTVMTAAGSPNDLTYTTTSPGISFTLASLVVDGEDMSDLARADMTMTGLSDTTRVSIADIRSYAQTTTVDALSYSFAVDDPASGDFVAMNGTLSGVTFEGSVDIPMQKDPADIPAMLAAGFAIDGAITYASGKTGLSGNDAGAVSRFSSASQGGALRFAMDSAQLLYGLSQTQSVLNLAGTDIPFPVALELGEAGFHMLLPVGKSDADQDFEFSVTLDNLTMSDLLWDTFDAGGVLPREPATIALDLAGKARVLADILDPDATAHLTLNETPYGELNALTIRNLLISAAGAELSGTGDFTFDNETPSPFGELPHPVGAVALKLVGANGLLDKLIRMGIVSDQEAMGARMMMGMLAVPGEGNDTLMSRIRINEAGHITVNGQRIR